MKTKSKIKGNQEAIVWKENTKFSLTKRASLLMISKWVRTYPRLLINSS